MSEVKKILAAICFSDYCEGTLRFAARLAVDLGAQLTVVNVINVRDVAAISKIESMGYQISASNYAKEIEQEREELVREMIRRGPIPEDQVKYVFKVGHPFEQLLKSIDEEQADMIVIGPKGRTDLPHILLGSVAEKLLRHSPVTVVSHRVRKKPPLAARSG